MARFIIKKAQSMRPSIRYHETNKNMNPTPAVAVEVKENNKPIQEEVMTTSEKVALANEVLGTKPRTRRIKSDKGLIEKEEASTTILTEDNKELMFD